ncbi:hypothetical protein [Allosphingosinicella indica]|uniref:hypothetical protein n=1 Tax=Allosphingosinicella indica TaxID=941907 RepID=UPI000A1513F8|nr:hypothetical protein [Allosphingosinicella indica]
MPPPKKLKVFRTPIGFHDAFVAAPSQKAALEAWGADSNLFTAGIADRVDDPALMAEPLANPGKVIRRVRGTLAEHVAALPEASRSPERSPRTKKANSKTEASPKPAKPKPRPSRAALDRAEAALAVAGTSHQADLSRLRRKRAEIDREIRALEARQEREKAKLERAIDRARTTFERAMEAWRAQ